MKLDSKMKYPQDIYMSPRKAIQRFAQIIQRCHLETVKKSGNYRPEKEALDAAIFLYGIESLYGGEHWLRNAENVSRDCDIEVIQKVSNSSVYIRKAAALQLTEFESHTKNFIELIKKKQKPGYNPGEIELVIISRDKLGWNFTPKGLAKEVAKIGSKYKSIWFLTNDSEDIYLYHLIQLFPSLVRHDYKFLDKLNLPSTSDWMKILPPYGKFISSEGNFELQLPSCPICGLI